jgi:hypothetical protein
MFTWPVATSRERAARMMNTSDMTITVNKNTPRPISSMASP